jgi:DNA repair protein RadC
MEKKSHISRRKLFRTQFFANPESQLSDEIKLEILLSYSIPIGDLDNLVLTLIKKYRDIDGILNADYRELCKIKGIKENTASLIKIVSQIKNPRIEQGSNQSTQQARNDFQRRLYEEAQEQIPDAPPIVAERMERIQKESLFFSKALLKDTIKILPTLPDVDNLEDLRQYLIDNLKYGSSSSRQRYSLYIIKRMFPDGVLDKSLLDFARKFPNSQILSDVVFYRFCKAEPIMIQIISELLLPMSATGSLQRIHINQYLSDRYPSIKGIKEWSIAIVEALNGSKIAPADKKKVYLSVRQPLIQSFAYILHCEYPKPGVYSIESLMKNPYCKAMFWTEESLTPSLYELRNMGIIPRVSEIDTVRQFTTKYSASEIVDYLSGVQ